MKFSKITWQAQFSWTQYVLHSQQPILYNYYYLRQGGNVFARLCLFVCLSACVSAR